MSQTEPGPGGTSAPRNVQVLLGLFILWQLVFLPVSNGLILLQEVAEEDTPGGQTLDHLTGELSRGEGPWADTVDLCRRWGDVIGQWQGWSLFAPGPFNRASFLSVELRWKSPDGTGSPRVVRLLNPNEPDDITSYLRLGYSRFRKYESYLAVEVTRGQGETAVDAAPRWRRQIASRVRRRWSSMQAYLNWRWQTYQRQHPDCPEPEEIILHERCYAVPPPEEEAGAFQGPFDTPVARYRPQHPVPAGSMPVEAFNPETRQFEYLDR